MATPSKITFHRKTIKISKVGVYAEFNNEKHLILNIRQCAIII